MIPNKYLQGGFANTETHKHTQRHTVGRAAFKAERRTDGRQCRGQIKQDFKKIRLKKKKRRKRSWPLQKVHCHSKVFEQPTL